jgi:hypothetical protein
MVVSKIAGLGRAARSVVLGIEIQDDLPALEISQRDFRAIVGRKGEIWRSRTWFDHGILLGKRELTAPHDRSVRFRDYPAAKLMFPGFTHGMGHRHLPPQASNEDGFAQTGDEGTSVPPGVQVQQQVALGFQGERPMREISNRSPEESPDSPSRLPASQGISSPFRIEPFETLQGPDLLPQALPGLEESLLRVGTPEDEVEEISSPAIRDPFPPSDLLPEEPDLLVHNIAQAQSAWHGLGRILSRQDLGWEVQGPDDLQQRQAHHGSDPRLPLKDRLDRSLGRARLAIWEVGVGHVWRSSE